MAKIKAKEIVKDLRSGCSDAEIMAKYNLNEASLPMLYGKLMDADLLTQTDLDHREKMVDCPACGFSHDPNLDICPRCSVVKEKFLDRKEKEKNAPSSPPVSVLKNKKENFFPAEPFDRVKAFVVDYLILSVGVVITGFIVAFFIHFLTDDFNAGFGIAGYLAWIILGPVYFGFYESNRDGQTIGKKIFHIKIVTDEGASPSIPIAIIRLVFHFFCICFWIWVFGSLLGIFLYLIWDRLRIFDEEGRMWHDRVTGTRVISAEAWK